MVGRRCAEGATRREEALTVEGVGRVQVDGISPKEVTTDFVQREPDNGAPATERTEVRIVYTRRVLYVGISAFDDDPSRLVALEMQRDGNLWRDDSVTVVLDTEAPLPTSSVKIDGDALYSTDSGGDVSLAKCVAKTSSQPSLSKSAHFAFP